jgi:hypothetical protein
MPIVLEVVEMPDRNPLDRVGHLGRRQDLAASRFSSLAANCVHYHFPRPVCVSMCTAILDGKMLPIILKKIEKK